MRWIGWFAIVSSLLAGEGLRAQQPKSLAIRNVTVIVGDGSPPLAAQTVLIRG